MSMGSGMGGDGGFLGCKEGTQGGDGSVMEMGGGWWAKGEGSAKIAAKGIGEGCIAFVLREVGLKVTKKDLAKGGSNFITHSKLGMGKV